MSLVSFVRTVWTAGQGVLVGLPEAKESCDPFELFKEWFDGAQKASMLEPTAVTLATCSGDGRPSARTVLLKGSDERGFVFYSNYASRKARDLEANDSAALVFYWPVLARQICVEGRVTKVSKEESASYFRSRSRGSQIGAWASKQSQPLTSRAALITRFKRLKKEFDGREVELPPFWGGYRLEPDRIQFWQAGTSRLHDRISFERSESGWVGTRLFP